MDRDDIKNKLDAISTTHFCDASPNIRIFNKNLICLSNIYPLIGRAYTVKTDGDLLPVIQAIESALPGDVLVISSGDSGHALFGELFTTAAQKKGITGIIIDGYCRDIAPIRSMAMPFYAKGIYPAAGTKHQLGQNNVPIHCNNLFINPGDIIFGDDSGLIALCEMEFIELYPKAQEIKNKEIKALKQLQEGKSLSDIFNFNEHIEKLSHKQQSTLTWV